MAIYPIYTIDPIQIIHDNTRDIAVIILKIPQTIIRIGTNGARITREKISKNFTKGLCC